MNAADSETKRHELLNRIASKLDAAAAWRMIAEEFTKKTGLPAAPAIREADRLESEARQIQDTLERDG